MFVTCSAGCLACPVAAHFFFLYCNSFPAEFFFGILFVFALRPRPRVNSCFEEWTPATYVLPYRLSTPRYFKSTTIGEGNLAFYSDRKPSATGWIISSFQQHLAHSSWYHESTTTAVFILIASSTVPLCIQIQCCFD